MTFYQPDKLPKLMVAPNGAKKVKQDHPEVPLTIKETVEVAKKCFEAGAGAIHLHVRNDKGCLLYTSPSPRDRTRSRMPSSA